MFYGYYKILLMDTSKQNPEWIHKRQKVRNQSIPRVTHLIIKEDEKRGTKDFQNNLKIMNKMIVVSLCC
jgi:hypothetical protein